MTTHETSPQNSSLREVVNKPLALFVKLLHENLPWLTPNEITFLGTLGLGTFVLYVSRLEKQQRINTSTGIALIAGFAALSGTDALDGSLARYKQSQGDTSHDTRTGQLVDSLSDRVQEAFLSWLAMYRAAESGDKLWLVTATLTALTNPLSSLVRAWAESEGLVVPESGASAFEFLGTRAGRVATATTRFLPNPTVSGISPQAVIDGVSAAATTKTTISRLQAVFSQDRNMAETTLQENAKQRLKWLGGLALITGVTTGILAYQLNKTNNERNTHRL